MTDERTKETNADERIILAHGGGGEATRRLLDERILPKLANGLLDPLTDGAVLDVPAGRICMTTDAYTVQPIFFPGGDIGRLAVCGTVNDLAVMGARPIALSLAIVMEEGLSLRSLDIVVDSVASAAAEASVPIATGDTKVIERARGDGLTITTAGIGLISEGVSLGMGRVCPSDVILVNGGIAEHGLAVMSAREGLGIETELRSDVAPLAGLISRLLEDGCDVKFLRDPTRGGLAGVLADLAEGTGMSVEVREASIPLTPIARHTAELLGLDPLTVANEGKVVAVVAESAAERALAIMRDHPLGRQAEIIGRVTADRPALVELITRAGGRRIVQRPYGRELPRIC